MSRPEGENDPDTRRLSGAPDVKGPVASGARAGLPYALAGSLLAFSFGVLARPVMGPVAAIVMSVVVFA